MEEEPKEEEELSDLHQAFVDEYVISRNATKAYQKIYGCSYESANANASPLMKIPKIQAAIIEAMEASSKRCRIDQDWVLTRLIETTERCMQNAPVLDKKGDRVRIETPDGEDAVAYTFQAMGALKGIELAGKNLGMFKDRVELEGELKVTKIERVIVKHDSNPAN